MTIGLSSDEMFDVVLKQAFSRLQDLGGQMTAAQVGENPEMGAILQVLQEQYLGFQVGMYLALIELAKALLDAIVANNNALAKVVPHVESP